MTYPLKTRTHFSSEKTAWSFAQSIGKIKHGWIVKDFGVDPSNEDEPFFVETWEDPFSTKDELLRRACIIR